MDYEKLHKDTIAKLQEMVNSGKITVETACGICADFVPESEDERIRKSIIGFLITISSLKDGKTVSNKDFDSKAILEWVAWLEKQYADPIKEYWRGYNEGKQNVLDKYAELKKQGEQNLANSAKTCKDEQKPVVIIPKFKIGDNIKTANEEPLTITKIDDKGYWSEDLFICGFEDITRWELVEQNPAEVRTGYLNVQYAEQKPTDNKMKEILRTEYEKGRADAIEEMQKTAWSEEDEKGLGDALWAIQQASTIAKDENDMGNVWFAENWLKSLKDRVQLQSKKEWSEDDSEYLDSIIESYKDLIADYKASHDVDYIPYDSNTVVRTVTNDVNFLKTLKGRHTWKPSDEQMGIIAQSVAVLKVSGYGELGDRLGDISEQLNKLR